MDPKYDSSFTNEDKECGIILQFPHSTPIKSAESLLGKTVWKPSTSINNLDNKKNNKINQVVKREKSFLSIKNLNLLSDKNHPLMQLLKIYFSACFDGFSDSLLWTVAEIRTMQAKITTIILCLGCLSYLPGSLSQMVFPDAVTNAGSFTTAPFTTASTGKLFISVEFCC